VLNCGEMSLLDGIVRGVGNDKKLALSQEEKDVVTSLLELFNPLVGQIVQVDETFENNKGADNSDLLRTKYSYIKISNATLTNLVIGFASSLWFAFVGGAITAAIFGTTLAAILGTVTTVLVTFLTALSPTLLVIIGKVIACIVLFIGTCVVALVDGKGVTIEIQRGFLDIPVGITCYAE
ncbi:MAG: hypothetical protein FWD76_03880, partial [Firmicutes bacterium]|nr:hypothetical protein [Bacillota bacterium]